MNSGRGDTARGVAAHSAADGYTKEPARDADALP